MAYTKTAELSNVRGGWIEIGTITLDPADLAGNTKVAETVTIAGLASGDQVFANVRDLTAKLVVTGVSVTGTDELSVYIFNADEDTAANAGSLTFDVMIIHNS
jgi:hypothetical protein